MVEESGLGTGTIIGITLIVFFVFIFVLFSFSETGVVTKTKEAVKGLIGEKGEVAKIFEEVFYEEEVVRKEDKERAGKIADFFGKQFEISDEECVKRIDFSEIKNLDLKARFRGSLLQVIKGKELRVDNFPLINSVSYIKEGEEFKGEMFELTDGFSKIDKRIKLASWIYKKDKKGGKIYFLDESSAVDLGGEYSPVFAKKECGKEKEEIKKMKLIAKEGVIDKIQESFDKEVSDMILHLWYIFVSGEFNSLKFSLVDKYWDLVLSKVSKYYNENVGENCWRYSVYLNEESFPKGVVSSKRTWGSGGYLREEEGEGFERFSVEVREGDTRGRKIAEITLLLSNAERCRKV